MPKVLFIATHRPDRSPSQRFRFEQYLDYLKANRWDYDFSYLITEKADKVFYRKGHFFQKLFIILRGFLIRLNDVMRANRYDIIFIQREAFITGTTFFEKRFSKSKAKLIFDFDDSIWLSNVSDANKKWNWLKNPDKTRKIISFSDLIFAGNAYLAEYALQFNKQVTIIPTTIDTDEYRRMDIKNDTICIGWSGSITTIQHFEYALPFLKEIKDRYGDSISIKVIGDSSYTNTELGIQGIGWNKADEIRELSGMDIGIMPLPDDEWAKGKCGLKGLQYMAMGIPTIMSPVGVNSEIIQDGTNGFLASGQAEWVEKIARLIDEESLRKSVGKAGRETVLKQYSVEANKALYLHHFNQLIQP
ncbi:MAG: glycosyltransferase family 4 protein [Flavobacteriales bacterium]|nr:glycosyltransferase family 4 protein [Flavobacteriales bacterium]